MNIPEMQARTAALIGEEALLRLSQSHVTVVGLGGVGGHCAESLARAGVGRLHLVDMDTVNESNLNRQLVATKRTMGRRKTDAMRDRLLDVSDCAVTTCDCLIGNDTAEAAIPIETDFIVDAIDMMSGKLALVMLAQSRGTPILSCMGAGNRLDPGAFTVCDIFETEGCPLARRMRHELRAAGVNALPVVFSREAAHTAPGQRVIGSLAPVTAAAGLCAAGYVLRQLAFPDAKR